MLRLTLWARLLRRLGLLLWLLWLLLLLLLHTRLGLSLLLLLHARLLCLALHALFIPLFISLLRHHVLRHIRRRVLLGYFTLRPTAEISVLLI